MSKLRDFEILHRIGAGSFGTVFSARRKKTGKMYVMKKIQLEGTTREEKSSAVKEVKLLASLRSKYVVQYFDSFSETELVQLSPLWFLALHFGISGLHAERAIHAILSGRAGSFAEGLNVSLKEVSPVHLVLVFIVFTPPFLFFRLDKLTSPLLVSTATTAIWAAILYLFFLGVFPSL